MARFATLVARMQRGGLLLEALPVQIANPQWQASAITEFSSWQTSLEDLPRQVPPGYTEVEAALVRWARAVGAAGDAYATAIAARDARQLLQASEQMRELPALYTALQDALLPLSEATPD
jgi:hypothetical protein